MSAPVRLRGSTYVLLAGLACLAASVQAADPPNESGEVEEAHSDPIIVLGDRRNDASSVLRSGLGPLDVSRAVQVFSRTLLDEVRPETIDDALTLISNVAYQGDTDGRENAFLIRGFQSRKPRSDQGAKLGLVWRKQSWRTGQYARQAPACTRPCRIRGRIRYRRDV